MAEGVADSGRPVDAGAASGLPGSAQSAGGGRPPEPAPDPEAAPYGWMWEKGQWRARKRSGRAGLKAAAAPAEDPAEDRDPDPAHMAPGAPPAPALWDPSKVSRQTQDDIAGMLALFYSLPADFLITVDPYCFGALNDNLDATISATVPIICRSRLAVEFITSSSGLILWIKLLATLKPFLVAAWQHHVVHSVELVQVTDEKTGKPTGRVEVLKQDLSAYTIVRNAA